MKTILFVEQWSDQVEHCSRCEMLSREVVIPAKQTHWAMIEDPEDMDRRPRTVLCTPCKKFIRQAMAQPG